MESTESTPQTEMLSTVPKARSFRGRRGLVLIGGMMLASVLAAVGAMFLIGQAGALTAAQHQITSARPILIGFQLAAAFLVWLCWPMWVNNAGFEAEVAAAWLAFRHRLLAWMLGGIVCVGFVWSATP